MPQPRGSVLFGSTERGCCGGPSLGELSGGNWMTAVDGRSFTGVVSVTGRVRSRFGGAVPFLVITNFCPPSGEGCGRGRGEW